MSYRSRDWFAVSPDFDLRGRLPSIPINDATMEKIRAAFLGCPGEATFRARERPDAVPLGGVAAAGLGRSAGELR